MCIASYGWLPPLRGENQGKAQVKPIHSLHRLSLPTPSSSPPSPLSNSPAIQMASKPFKGVIEGIPQSCQFGAVAMTALLCLCQLHGVSPQWL